MDLDDLKHLQEEVLGALGSRPWLRRNDDTMLTICLREHHTAGVRVHGRLVAAGVLYEAGKTKESLIRGGADQVDPDACINLKVVLVHPGHRGSGLAQVTLRHLEAHATASGKQQIRCTIHPENIPSKGLFENAGYRRSEFAETSYGPREIYIRDLQTVH